MVEIEYPGVAQLVGRDIWDVEVGCSSHLTRTKIPLKSLISEGFSYSLSIAAQEAGQIFISNIACYIFTRTDITELLTNSNIVYINIPSKKTTDPNRLMSVSVAFYILFSLFYILVSEKGNTTSVRPIALT